VRLTAPWRYDSHEVESATERAHAAVHSNLLLRSSLFGL